MTIIEAALEKTKALRGVRPESAGQPGPAASSPGGAAHARRSSDAAPVDAVPPSTQIQAQRVSFDARTARENRLLVGGGKDDQGAIAAYGMLRTRLLHRMKAHGWCSVGVTSASPQDGKSLTAVNLALSLAREKNNLVVLLDLDMRNPSVCRTLGITPPVELLNFFNGSLVTPAETFMSIGLDNLIIAGNITATENSAELLASTRLEELLAFIKNSTHRPLILIDLPPVLSPEDTLEVAPRIDSLLLVAAEGVTPRTELQKAAALLADFKLAGILLNRSSDTSMPYGYGYGYGENRQPG